MDLQARRREELSSATNRLASLFRVRRGRFVTALQIPFSLIYLPMAAVLALSSEILRPGLAVAGVVVVVSASVFARCARADPVAVWVPGLLCGACLTSLGLLVASLGTHGYLLTIVALLPATWLAYAYLWPGAIWGVVGTVALMVVTACTDAVDLPPLDGAYLGILPLLAVAMTSVCVIVTESWEVQRSRLRAEQARLDVALSQAQGTTVLLEAMLESMDSAVVAFDTEGRTLLANASHLYPLSWAGAVGESERLIFDEDSTTPVSAQLYPSELAKHGVTVDERLMWFGPPGPHQRAVLATSRPMTGSDGTRHGVMAVYHDITTVMRAVKIKDDFVETVSHELRTPLTSILGYLELIRDDHHDGVSELPEETVEYLDVVDRNANHLLDLVSDLLTTAKSAADALKVTRAPADLSTIVGRSVESARPRFDAAGIRLSLSSGALPDIRIDSRRISQVVDNLLSNALKYTPSGGQVVLSTGVHGDDVVLSVEDTGIGMSQDDLVRIFDKFHRARSATDLHIPGIGLGLAISKAIVDAHDGTIVVTSTAGEGTTVTLTLPGPVVS